MSTQHPHATPPAAPTTHTGGSNGRNTGSSQGPKLSWWLAAAAGAVVLVTAALLYYFLFSAFGLEGKALTYTGILIAFVTITILASLIARQDMTYWWKVTATGGAVGVILSLLLAGGEIAHKVIVDEIDEHASEDTEWGQHQESRADSIWWWVSGLGKTRGETLVADEMAIKHDEELLDPTSERGKAYRAQVTDELDEETGLKKEKKSEVVGEISARLGLERWHWRVMFITLIAAALGIALWGVLSAAFGVGMKRPGPDAPLWKTAEYWADRVLVRGLGKFAIAGIILYATGFIEQHAPPAPTQAKDSHISAHATTTHAHDAGRAAATVTPRPTTRPAYCSDAQIARRMSKVCGTPTR